ncbi:MAG TPA: alpha/beta fold hydrolase [Oscillatoriaceae cyanobacterium]
MRKDMLTTVNGLEFNYVHHGVGPTLVLLHAFPLNYRMWEPQITGLNDMCHVLALDMRGFGASEATDGDFTIENLADDLHALMQHLGHERFVLGGSSMGGYVAMAYAERYPEDLMGLALIATRATADTPEKREERLKTAASVSAFTPATLAKTMAPTMFAPEYSKERPNGLLSAVRAWISGTPPLTIAGAQRAMANRPDRTQVLAGFQEPVLVIAGEQDQIMPPDAADQMVEVLPYATLVRVPNAGHLPNMEQPEIVNQALRQFMKQFTPKPAAHTPSRQT